MSAVSIMASLEFSADGLIGSDGYFHSRYAASLHSRAMASFPPVLTQLPLTILAPDSFSDHHLLYHVALAPFASWDVLTGAKVATALFAALAITCFAMLLRAIRVAELELWTVVLLASTPVLLYRLAMPRVNGLAVAFLLTSVWALVMARPIALLISALAYSWVFTGAFLVLLPATSFAVTSAWNRERRGMSLWAAATGGVLLGVLLNPYFPHSVSYLLARTRAIAARSSIEPAAEWMPYPVAQFAADGPVLTLLLLALGLAAAIHWSRISTPLRTLILTTMVLMAATLCSRRFVEYLAPLAVAASALAWQELRARAPAWVGGRRLRLFVWFAVTLGAVFNINAVRASVAREPPPSQLAATTQWLDAHIPQDVVIFNVHWDDFPRLFFHSENHRYVIGLDPAYLWLRDEDRYVAWERIARGAEPAVAEGIQRWFGAEFAIARASDTGFLRAALADPTMTHVYSDGESVIFAITIGQRVP